MFQIRACSSTDRASDYGSEGWGFESLQAHISIRKSLSASINGCLRMNFLEVIVFHNS
jgi:hypothetical protein